MINIILRSPLNCSNMELERFKNLLRKRSEIDPLTVDRRIQRAHKLAFAYVDSVLVGIGAVKYATPGFRNRILRAHNEQFLQKLPDKELGWFFVKEGFRGKRIGSNLFHNINKTLHRIQAFALTSSDNEAMRKLLISGGYSSCGEIALDNRPSYILFINDACEFESD